MQGRAGRSDVIWHLQLFELPEDPPQAQFIEMVDNYHPLIVRGGPASGQLVPDAAHARLPSGRAIDVGCDHVLCRLERLPVRPEQPQAEAVAVSGHDEFACRKLNLGGDRIVAHRIGMDPGECQFGEVAAGIAGCEECLTFGHKHIP